MINRSDPSPNLSSAALAWSGLSLKERMRIVRERMRKQELREQEQRLKTRTTVNFLRRLVFEALNTGQFSAHLEGAEIDPL